MISAFKDQTDQTKLNNQLRQNVCVGRNKKSILGREKSNYKKWIINQPEQAPNMQIEIIIGRFPERYSKCNSKSVFQTGTLIPVRSPPKAQSVSSVAQMCLTFCDPMDCSMPGFPVHHQLLELSQTHVHQASDGIQPSHPLSSPSPSAFNLSQHWGLFQ